ncbi:MAG: CaiB/BaiF CoA-transferase family protein [Bacteroidota bacterium]
MRTFAGYTVLELANVLAGPSVGMFFAELGARVIKVENVKTKGDVTRSWKVPTEKQETDISAYFSTVNWGKESIAIDLSKPSGQEIVHHLARRSHFVISSYLPGQAEKLVVDAASLLNINPELVCGEISGYGPGVQRAAYDAIIQAEAGFTAINGEPGQTFKMPVALMDVLAGHQLKEAMLLAHIERLQSGKGQRVHVSLIRSGISSLVNQATNWLVAGHLPSPIGSGHPNIVPYGNAFTTLDGKQIVLAIGSDAQFAALAQVMGKPLPADFRTNAQRIRLRDEVLSWVADGAKNFAQKDFLSQLFRAKVPAGPVNKMDAVFEADFAQSTLHHSPDFKGIRQLALDLPADAQTLSPPPSFGEHSLQILQELGFEEKQISKLKAAAVIS